MNVNVMSNMSQINNRTSSRIFQVSAESPESSELLCSSFYRRSGTPFDWVSNIGGPLFRARLIKLSHVIMPLIPNINLSNNQFCFQMYNQNSGVILGIPFVDYNPINVEITMPLGYYSPDVFSNDFILLLTNAIYDQLPGQVWSSTETVNTVNNVVVTAAYDYKTMRYELDINVDDVLTDVASGGQNLYQGVSHLLYYWMPQNCTFIMRGKNFIDFPDAPFQPKLEEKGSMPDPYLTANWNPPSSSSALAKNDGLTSLIGPSFIYSRYLTITSEALILYSYGESRVDRSGQTGADARVQASSGGGGGKIIGVLSTSQYVPATKSFNGANRISAIDAPSIGIKNSQLKLNEFIDFQITDEFGLSLNAAFPEDNNWGPTLAFIVGY